MGTVEQLVAMSNRYGADGNYTLAGGGNTSCKVEDVLYVKASGTQLATIQAEGFVRMDMPQLLEMLAADYPAEDKAREAKALAGMNAAKLPGQGGLRPSVECLLHALFPYTFVLHLHPALVNGLTCGQSGEADCKALFGEGAVWVPLIKPGYVLAKACGDAFVAYRRAHGKAPQLLMMQNHGLMVAADTVEELDALMDKAMDALMAKVTRRPDFSPVPGEPPAAAEILAPALRGLYAGERGTATATFWANREVLRLVENEKAAEALQMPFTPDQIVYCKDNPLWLRAEEDPAPAFAGYVAAHGYPPKIVLVEKTGFFALGANWKEADAARQLLLDSLKVAVYAESFGGPLPLPRDFVDFILHWEVENYRQKVSLAGDAASRMQGKVCVVTGAAQGFGEGIARCIAKAGGTVVVADMNEAGAGALAGQLCEAYGPGRALGLAVNVADDASVAEMVRRTVLAYGGLDVMVSCAGILIAGSLEAMTKENFEKVTAVNYTGYFLCAKYACVPMKRQRAVQTEYSADIIEINSKSGLEGSKANSAYAGGKFGGIGLTQSFAMELAPFGIKVNAICPGNLLDGPLWSDPERGLFRQYLEAGKVPGAKTVEDVRAFYEAKVLLGRGCTVEDVVIALFYLVEQQYETGQALPVTGGQVMLN